MEIVILIKIGLLFLAIRWGRDEVRKYKDYTRRRSVSDKAKKRQSPLLEKEGRWWRRKVFVIKVGVASFVATFAYGAMLGIFQLPDWMFNGIWIFYGLTMLSAATYGIMLAMTDPSW